MFKLKKINNNGSTMVMAVIAIAFVALLASTILMASYGNLMVKKMNSNSKDTFYTAETVIDEIKAGVGHDSIAIMSQSYEKVLGTLVYDTSEGYKMIKDNALANTEMREGFIEGVLDMMTAGELSFGSAEIVTSDNNIVLDKIVAYLNTKIVGYVDGEKSAEVKSVGKIIAAKNDGLINNKIVIQDVVIAYKEKKTGEVYFSNVTVDLDVTYPNMTVSFNSANTVSSFLQYSLIADTDINVTACKVNVHGAHIYSGKDINVVASSAALGEGAKGELIVTGNVREEDGTTTNANIVARKDIIIQGAGAYISEFTVNGGDIWCNNLTANNKTGSEGYDISLGANITIDQYSNTYLRDDLNIYGQLTNANISGNLYAYSYDGAGVNEHTQSSAIIVNGKASMLKLSLGNLIVGGRSYVLVDDGYMTGESLSVRADQDLYLIPSKYIYETSSNPMSASAWEALQQKQANPSLNENGDLLVDTEGFFGSDLLQPYGTGTDETPYVAKESGGIVYLYYRFKDKASAGEYVKRILDGVNADAQALRENLNTYFAGVFSSSSSGINIQSGTMYSAGVLMQKSNSGVSNTGSLSSGTSDNVSYANPGAMQPDVFMQTSMDCANRYKIINNLLVDLPDMKNGNKYIVNDIDSALTDLYGEYTGDTEFDGSRTASSYIVDFGLIETAEYNSSTTADYNLVMYDAGVTKIATKGDIIVPSYITGGIILSGGSVTLNHNFTGLIICQGSINLTNDAVITTDMNMVESLIRTEYVFIDDSGVQVEYEPENDFRYYFYAYRGNILDDVGAKPIEIEKLSYSDLVGANNWRKYDDGN